MAVNESPGALAGATGAGNAFQAAAGGIHKIASNGRYGTPFRETPSAGEPFCINVKGRDRWALEELRKAGAKDCTPIDNPASRWSGYVFNLPVVGVEIETITEPHKGDLPERLQAALQGQTVGSPRRICCSFWDPSNNNR